MESGSRELIKAFAQFVGLDPKQVSSLTLEANANSPVLIATATMFVAMSEKQEADFLQALQRDERQLIVVMDSIRA